MLRDDAPNVLRGNFGRLAPRVPHASPQMANSWPFGQSTKSALRAYRMVQIRSARVRSSVRMIGRIHTPLLSIYRRILDLPKLT